jgi:hypothetical protein
MPEMMQPKLDAPVPGESLTAELGSRPWQQPPQYATVEEALDYYIPRLQSDEVSKQLIDVLEMGIPVTTIANTMQLGSVMEGKHSVDVGMLILPVLVELIMLIGDTAGVKYTSGLEKDKSIRGSIVDLAVSRFENQKNDEEVEVKDTSIPDKMISDEVQTNGTGLMSRSK